MASHGARQAAAVKAKETTPSFFEALYAARDADAQEITGGIHLGAASAAGDRKAMQKRRISHVLIVHPKLPEQHPQHFTYGRAPLLDEPGANLLELLPDALSFLGAARADGGRVFVYCAKGISRSASIVIALLMFERNIPFDEAFKICEQKRPIVYPNLGFQQQLRHLETLTRDSVDAQAPWEARVQQLRRVVPRGDLEGPKSPLRLRTLIGDSMGQVLEELEALTAKVCAQPQLLQQRELWKRHGLYFENLHKYKALPSSSKLIDAAKGASTTLKSLPKIFSDTLKGVKLAAAVAKELDAWVAFADPILSNPLLNPEAKSPDANGAEATAGAAQADGDLDDEDPMKEFLQARKMEEASKQVSGKKDKKLDKKSKKEIKAEKKIAKAAKKAEKAAAKIEKAAEAAERAAGEQRQRAELAAARAEAMAKQIADLEAEEAFEARAAAVAQRAGGDAESRARASAKARAERERSQTPEADFSRSASSSGSGDGSGRKAQAPRRRRAVSNSSEEDDGSRSPKRRRRR